MATYTSVIDLTKKAQQKTAEAGSSTLAEPDPALPPANLRNVPEPVRKAVRAMGWPKLAEVQARTIPYILQGRDLIVQSRTGSGKTGAFLLPLMKLLDPAESTTQALVLAPTRELARQVHGEFERMRQGSEQTQELRSALVYGGVGYGEQRAALKAGAHLVVGTPGRVLDHLEQRTLALDRLRVLILDEADEMLSMGFLPDMRQLKRYVPQKRQSYMFSATIPYQVQRLGDLFLNDPGLLSLSVGQVHVTTMQHRYYVVPPMEKDRALIRLVEMEHPDSAIIFANTKREVEFLTQLLRNYGYDAAEISGDLVQRDREAVMDRIRSGELRLLVATDVAARGIDISDLSHVFMYDVPQDPEYYVHRAGRTARAGKTGVAVVLVTPLDEKNLLSIKRKYDIEIEKFSLPSQDEVEARLQERIVVFLEDDLRKKSNLERERMRRFLPLVEQLVREGEPEVLAMLVDSFYQQQLHPIPESAPAKEPERIRQDEGRRQEGGQRQGGGRRRGRGRGGPQGKSPRRRGRGRGGPQGKS